MTIDHDAIAARVRQNREAGTPGPWALSASGYNVMRGKTAATVAVAQPSDFSLSDARRISALPDLEAAYLALYDEVKRLRSADVACAKCDAKGEDCGEHAPTWADLAADWKARAEKAEAERDRVAAEWAETSQRNYQRAKAAEARVAKMEAALVDHNDLLRSTSQIARREGIDGEIAPTNWDAYYNRVAVVLKRHHEISNTARAALKGDSDE